MAGINEESIFYVIAFIASLNILQWTYGVSIIKNEKFSFSFSKLIRAPFFIAIIVGIFFFISEFSMPKMIYNCVELIADTNTAIAMFTIGIYFAKIDIFQMLKNLHLYKISVIRLFIIPIMTLILLNFLDKEYYDMKMALLIASACPVGSNVAIYAQLHNKDYLYAVETVVISTLFATVTLPIVVHIATNIW